MKIHITSIFVDDQAKAQKFYSGILGFQVKNDVPMGEFRWLTGSLVSGGGA
jgi:catechol 2,3-dioxygenase-like lactoylglutathione lyase family enzyme